MRACTACIGKRCVFRVAVAPASVTVRVVMRVIPRRAPWCPIATMGHIPRLAVYKVDGGGG